jgi:hypothetical protein
VALVTRLCLLTFLDRLLLGPSALSGPKLAQSLGIVVEISISKKAGRSRHPNADCDHSRLVSKSIRSKALFCALRLQLTSLGSMRNKNHTMNVLSPTIELLCVYECI